MATHKFELQALVAPRRKKIFFLFVATPERVQRYIFIWTEIVSQDRSLKMATVDGGSVSFESKVVVKMEAV